MQPVLPHFWRGGTGGIDSWRDLPKVIESILGLASMYCSYEWTGFLEKRNDVTLSSKGGRKHRGTKILLLMTWQKGAWPRNTSHKEAQCGPVTGGREIQVGQRLPRDCKPKR